MNEDKGRATGFYYVEYESETYCDNPGHDMLVHSIAYWCASNQLWYCVGSEVGSYTDHMHLKSQVRPVPGTIKGVDF